VEGRGRIWGKEKWWLQKGMHPKLIGLVVVGRGWGSYLSRISYERKKLSKCMKGDVLT
jgi:hypothetical protein